MGLISEPDNTEGSALVCMRITTTVGCYFDENDFDYSTPNKQTDKQPNAVHRGKGKNKSGPFKRNINLGL